MQMLAYLDGRQYPNKNISIVLIYSLGKRTRENMDNDNELESLKPKEKKRTYKGEYLDLLSHRTFHNRI